MNNKNWNIKKNSFTRSFVLFLFIFVFCSENEKSVIEINPSKFNAGPIYLSDFAEDITYIRLDSSFIIPHVMSLDIFEDTMIVCTRPDCQLLAYDKTGRLLNKIGRQGHGPGEYQYPWEFSIDKKNRRVYILSKVRNQVLIYNIDGRFIRDIPVGQFSADFDDIEYRDKKIYLFEGNHLGYAKYNWLIIDTSGVYVDAKFNATPRFKVKNGYRYRAAFRLKDELYYWNQFNDTIFNIGTKGVSVKYLFAKGDFRLTPQNNDDISIFSKRVFIPHFFIKSRDILFFNYFVQDNWGIALHYKGTNTFQSFEMPYKRDQQFGIQNDLDGGVLFSPEQLVFIKNQEYLVSWAEAFMIKAHVASDVFKTSNPKFPEKKKELEKLAASLNENDNPVLMLVKMKK
jgi:hypothetical protein